MIDWKKINAYLFRHGAIISALLAVLFAYKGNWHATAAWVCCAIAEYRLNKED